jgi:tape measure domain protein|nr:MAG TPA: tail tape measure protein [Caudoviricetes sp.]
MAHKTFSVTLDPTEFIKGTKSLEESFDRLQQKIQGTSTKLPSYSAPISEARGEVDLLSSSFQRAAGLAAGIFAVSGVQDFVSKLYSVRGEFQQLEISFKTMLGSGEQANELLAQLAQTAASTPFDLQGIASSAKNMLAYGFAADQVNETIVRLGNVAAGLSQPLGDIVYLYGSLRASGRVTNIDIRQFANRGIPIYEELAKVLGKSVSEINSLVSAGKVGFSDIEQAFQNMTNKGGKFYNLMQAQSESLTGQISNLQDNIDMMFNELGKASEGVLSSGVKAVSYLVENYEKIGKVIAGLIVTYGVYRTAVITNIALTKGWTAAAQADTIARGLNTLSIKSLTAATNRLTAAMLANPYGAIAVALTAVIAAMWAFSDSTSAAERAQKDFNEEKKRAEEQEQKHKEAVEALLNVVRDEASATADRQSALEQLQKYYPQIFDKYDTETLKLQDIAKLKREIAEYDGKAKMDKAKSELGKAQEEVEKAKKALKDADGELAGGMVSGTAHAYKLHKAVERLDYAKKQLELKRKEFGKLSDSQLFNAKGLSELTDSQLSAMLINIQKAKRAVKQGREMYLTGSIIKDAYDEKGWENLAKQIKSEQEARKKPIKSYKDAVTDLKKEEEKANKELKAFNNLTAQQLKRKKEEAVKNGNYNWNPDEERKRLKEEYDLKKKAREEYEKGAGETSKKGGSRKHSKEESEAHTKARQAEERRQQEEQRTRDLARSRRDAELNLEAERIALMQDGFAKEMAELQLQHKRKMSAFDDQVQERLAKVREAEKLEWEATHDSKKEVYKQRKLTEADLSDTDLNQILAGRELADQALAEGQEKIIKELRSKYLSYEERKTEIKKRYEAERKIIDDTSLLLAEQKASALVELAKKEADELKAIDNERYEHTQRTNQLFVELFAQQGERTVAQMRSTIASAREMLDYLANTPADKLEGRFGMSADELASIQNSPEKLKAITDALRGLRDELGNSSPWQSFISSMEDALSRGKSALNDYKKARSEATSATTEEERASAQKKADIAFSRVGLSVTKIGKSVKDATPLVQDLGKSFGAIFGNSAMEDAVEGLTQALSDLGGVASGIGSIISGDVLGGITSIVGVVGNLVSRAQKVEREVLEKRRKALEALTRTQEEYNTALLKANLIYEKGSTIFGDDVYKRATNSIVVARQAMEQFHKSTAFSDKELEGNGVLDFLGIGPKPEDFPKQMRRAMEQIRKQIKNKLLPTLKGEFAKLQNISVKTGSHKEGILWARHSVDDYTTLGKLYPNLIDKSGKLNVALAESILKTHEFREGGKEALENMLALYKQNEEAIKTMNDYLHGLFGSLGNAITDSLVTAFRTGEDATRAFTSNIGDMLNNFAKQIAYSSFLAPLMEKAQKEVADALRLTGGDNQMEAMLRAMSSLVDGVKTQIPAFNEYLKKTEEMVQAHGFDLGGKNSDTRSATAKGIAQASQDSIDVLTGLWHTEVALSERTANATERMVTILSTQGVRRLPSAQDMGLDQFGTAVGRMYAELQAINRNTKVTADATEASRFILAQMDSKGIKIKR